MKYIFAALLLFSTSLLFAQTHYWQQQVNYQIQVSLNAHDKTLNGFEKIVYTNNSPDTLRFIWFHIWPNAYKNDKTAYCEQALENGSTKFYFSKEEDRGYINKLAFTVQGEKAIIETHQKHIDIVKLLLPKPLAPHTSITITTPFFVKLPYIFSRGGFEGNNIYATQWYPKPAVYDNKGWHEMPYLDQGEFYSEFGNFEVEIIVPENYLVAASGELQNKEQLQKLKTIGKQMPQEQLVYKQFLQQQKELIQKSKEQLAKNKTQKKVIIKQEDLKIAPSKNTVSYSYKIENAHDFAWFASPEFVVQYDTVQLQTKIVDVFSFYKPKYLQGWQHANQYTKQTLKGYSNYLGEYAYNTATTVCGIANDFSGGMEYPSITLITTQNMGTELEETIVHEIGHNWFYGALGSNERNHAWMDEGMNTYYQKRLMNEMHGSRLLIKNEKLNFINKRIPEDVENLLANTLKSIHKFQPIDESAEKYTLTNYPISVYLLGGKFLENLENDLGKEKFDNCMKAYYQQWKFKHPYPTDFKKTMEQSAGITLDKNFEQLHQTQPENNIHKQTKLIAYFSLKDTDKKNYFSFLPLLTYNLYDGGKFGLALHNYQIPFPKFQFYIAPQYALNSKFINYNARFSYHIYKPKNWLEISLGASKFTMDDFKPVNAPKLFQSVTRFTPTVKYIVYNKNPRLKDRWIFIAKSFLLNEDNLQFTNNGTQEIVSLSPKKTIINQLSITKANSRVLYPYAFNLKIEQGEQFVRLGFTGNYFFNYAKQKGGLNARLFAGKFIYTTDKTFVTQYKTWRYHLNMGGTTGAEDYTYSNYFLGRNEFNGWQSQQIMQKDGFLKVRATQLSEEFGRTDDWLMAVNLHGNIPNAVNIFNALPIKLPIQFFADMGTYANAWKDNPATGRFLFDAGLQLSFFKGTANVYFPLLYSKVYRDYYKSTITQKRFWKTVSFSIDIQKLQLHNIHREIPL